LVFEGTHFILSFFLFAAEVDREAFLTSFASVTVSPPSVVSAGFSVFTRSLSSSSQKADFASTHASTVAAS
jgi:hypothetical protein